MSAKWMEEGKGPGGGNSSARPGVCCSGQFSGSLPVATAWHLVYADESGVRQTTVNKLQIQGF